MSGFGCQKTEDRGQMIEVGSGNSEVGKQKVGRSEGAWLKRWERLSAAIKCKLWVLNKIAVENRSHNKGYPIYIYKISFSIKPVGYQASGGAET